MRYSIIFLLFVLPYFVFCQGDTLRFVTMDIFGQEDIDSWNERLDGVAYLAGDVYISYHDADDLEWGRFDSIRGVIGNVVTLNYCYWTWKSLETIRGRLEYLQCSGDTAALPPNLKVVYGEFQVGGTTHLKSFRSTSLDSVYGMFRFVYNTFFDDLGGFSNLRYCGGMILRESIVLENLEEFSDSLYIDGDLIIDFCPELDYCNEPAICSHLERAEYLAFFDLNGSNCSDRKSVIESCLTSSPDNSGRMCEQQHMELFDQLLFGEKNIDDLSQKGVHVEAYGLNGSNATNQLSSLITHRGHALYVLVFSSNGCKTKHYLH